MIAYESSCSLVKGSGIRNGVEREISLTISHSGKKASIDGKPVLCLTDFFGTLNMVVFSPEDISMVRGLPELRRRYLDRAVFSGDGAYLALHHEYFRTLKNRNALLKRGVRDGLSVWTDKLADTGSRVAAKRLAFIGELSDLLRDFYTAIAGPGQQASLSYRSRWMERNSPSLDIRRKLRETLEANIPEELRRGTTLNGPHRDDLYFMLNGKALNHHGSQGEQRSFILALKMAEIEYLKKVWGTPPLLLLDDMTSELDRDRNGNFMHFLKEKEMQVFITTTSLENINLSGISNYSTFPVHDGKVFTEVANV